LKELVDLELSETLDAFEKAARKGVMGRRVYDYGHVLGAEKAGADVILTRNTADFIPLTSQAVQWP